MDNHTFPHINLRIRDQSRGEPLVPRSRPLHNPAFFVYAEKGQPNVPKWGTINDHIETFGRATFDRRSKFYQHPTVFAENALRFQEAYIVRLAPDDVKTASLVLEAQTSTSDFIQFEKDSLGNRIEDTDGNPVPRTEADGSTPVTEPGISITYVVRELDSNENIDTLQPRTVRDNGEDTTFYPILASSGAWPNSATNRIAFKMWYSLDFEESVVDNIDAMTYNFALVERDPRTGIAAPIRDFFGQPTVRFTFKPNAEDTTTARFMSFPDIIRDNFGEDFPVVTQDYPDSIAELAQKVKDVSPELDELSIWRINILSAQDENGVPYDHFRVIDGAQVLNEDVNLYHRGGADGTLTKDNLESLTGQYLNGDLFPDITDQGRFPITHIYDSGYALERKKDLIRFLALRDDVKVDLSTQDNALLPNKKAEDVSTAASLRAELLLRPESVIEGTPAMRGSIYAQTGILNTRQGNNRYVPTTLDRLIKRTQFEGNQFITGTPKGRPNSEVDIYNKLNWTPANSDFKQRSWDLGMNYIQYADANTLFRADMRSIYPFDTSLLSSDTHVDRLIYIKHIARREWTIFVGREDDIDSLADDIATSVTDSINTALNGTMDVQTTVQTTALDRQKGFSRTIIIATQGTPSNRVWNVIVPVSRRSE